MNSTLRARGQIVRVLRLTELVLRTPRAARVGPIGDDAHGAPAASVRNRSAHSSGFTPCTRNSVERRTRETNELTTIATMNIAAILMPAGRSAMFTIVV